MSTYRRGTFVCAGVLFASAVCGSEGDPRADKVEPGPAAAGVSESGSRRRTANERAVVTGAFARGPIVHPRVPARVTAKLINAVPLARRRLRTYSSCRALFARLGADGNAMLTRSRYHRAGTQQEKEYCHGDIHAMTTVGGSVVVLCRSFARLSDREAAVILIHEALHLAGQTEYPLDRDAPDAYGISKMVMGSCRLF
jgi:hypothetical protein